MKMLSRGRAVRLLITSSLLLVAVAAFLPAAPASAQPGVFVPAPKGSGESLDSTANPGATGQGGSHLVTTTRGDRITGQVLTIDSAGKVRLSGSQFAGEVAVLAATVDTVALNGPAVDGKDELQLTNGDRIRGEIVSITPSAILFDTPAAGSLKVNRRFVRAAFFGQGAAALVESDFANGLAPWTAGNANGPGMGRRGGMGGGGNSIWSVEEGSLLCRSNGQMESLWTKLNQKEAETLVCKFQVQNYTNCSFILFADNNQNWYGSNSVYVNLQGGECYLNVMQQGNQQQVASRNINRNNGNGFQGGTLRFSYDPETGKAHVWIDEQDLGEYTVPNKIASGQYVMLNGQCQIKITDLRVLRGIVPPGETTAVGADTTTVQFANKDRVSVQAIALADGQFVITTPHGELKSPLEAVQGIVFGKKEIEEQRRQKGDVRVTIGSSRLTLQFDQLTADALLGRSDVLGDVKIKRAAVKTVAFNIYRNGGKPAAHVAIPVQDEEDTK